MIVKNAFNDVTRSSTPRKEGVGGLDYLDKVAALQIGSGSKVLRADQTGIWLGAETFADAPFSVDMQGNLVATSGVFGDVLTKSDTDQALSGSIIVSGYIMVKVSGTPTVVIGTVA